MKLRCGGPPGAGLVKMRIYLEMSTSSLTNSFTMRKGTLQSYRVCQSYLAVAVHPGGIKFR